MNTSTVAAVAAASAVGLAIVARRRRGGRLDGKVIVITGGSSGNGRAAALECARRGARVVIAARHIETLERVADEIRELGGEVMVVTTDVRERVQVQRLVDRTLEHFGRIDAMVNNAAAAFLEDVGESSPEDIQWLLESNVWSVIHGIQVALPVMRRQGFGHIVNTASVAGRVGFPKMGVYCATKAFVEVLTQVLRQEVVHIERSAIRVSAVSPVAVRTPYFDKIPNHETGGRGGFLTGPILEAHHVGNAIADAIAHDRPVVYPFAPAKGLLVMYDLFPGLTDKLMTVFRPDRPVSPFTSDRRGSHRAERPITPVVRDGRLDAR